MAARSHPTLIGAARGLGILQSTMVIQINCLEANLGQPLSERAERGTAMKLTRFGNALSRQPGRSRLKGAQGHEMIAS
ncbi:helix-turn-helix domain-containing protein [Streptomyces phaeochromogenes]|uniref:helix-turn-helix domain-containing protein n=1 Tax=Streptomyces phaeochromogenes TaxID=1923 RepID=UPI002E149B54